MTPRTILVTHSNVAFLEEVSRKLSDPGFQAIGSAVTARLALASAATAPTTLALLGERLREVRDGRVLAKASRTRWGAPTTVLPDSAAEVA